MTDEPNPFCTSLPTQLRAWDATSLSSYSTCPRKYLYEIVQGWRLPPSDDIEFGRIYHASIEEYDRARCRGLSKAEATNAAVAHALEATWIDGEPWRTSNTKKTRHTLLRAVVWYCDEQKDEDGVQPFRFPDGRPGVEISFQLPLPLENPDGEPYLMCGHIDSIAHTDGDVFPRERKTTQNSLGPWYFDQYEPNIQVDTYDLAFSILFPDLRSAGVMLEATQTAVGFARFHRHFIHKTEGQRAEQLTAIQDTIRRAEDDAIAGHYPMNKASCYARGGCPFRDICNKDPAVRDRFLAANFVKSHWNPLAER